jgi:hypothetical protein
VPLVGYVDGGNDPEREGIDAEREGKHERSRRPADSMHCARAGAEASGGGGGGGNGKSLSQWEAAAPSSPAKSCTMDSNSSSEMLFIDLLGIAPTQVSQKSVPWYMYYTKPHKK